MASAEIIFDNSKNTFTLPALLGHLREQCGLAAELGELRFADSAVRQIHVLSSPPFALQLSENPEIIPVEIEELLDGKRGPP